MGPVTPSVVATRHRVVGAQLQADAGVDVRVQFERARRGSAQQVGSLGRELREHGRQVERWGNGVCSHSWSRSRPRRWTVRRAWDRSPPRHLPATRTLLRTEAPQDTGLSLRPRGASVDHGVLADVPPAIGIADAAGAAWSAKFLRGLARQDLGPDQLDAFRRQPLFQESGPIRVCGPAGRISTPVFVRPRGAWATGREAARFPGCSASRLPMAAPEPVGQGRRGRGGNSSGKTVVGTGSGRAGTTSSTPPSFAVRVSTLATTITVAATTAATAMWRQFGRLLARSGLRPKLVAPSSCRTSMAIGSMVSCSSSRLVSTRTQVLAPQLAKQRFQNWADGSASTLSKRSRTSSAGITLLLVGGPERGARPREQ